MKALECMWCGGVAFKFKSDPVEGSIVHTTDVVLLDGTVPEVGDDMVCGSCDYPIMTCNLISDFLVSGDN